MTADIKSSGIAAPTAQPHHAGELGASMASYSADLKNGANNFMLMIERAHEISEETVLSFGDDIDGRDYRAMAFEIETAIYTSMMGSGKATREGFLRAFADFIAIHMDGAGLPSQWDPLATTGAAFARAGGAQHDVEGWASSVHCHAGIHGSVIVAPDANAIATGAQEAVNHDTAEDCCNFEHQLQQIEVDRSCLHCDYYRATPQQLLDARLVTPENLAILDGGKKTLRLFPDGRPWLGKTSYPKECREPGAKFIEPDSGGRLRVQVIVSQQEQEKRLSRWKQERQAAASRLAQAQQQGKLQAVPTLKEQTYPRLRLVYSDRRVTS